MTRSLALFLLASASAQAAVTLQLASSAFQYRYEMDTAPNNQNLDGNGVDDWFDTTVPTVSGGYAANTTVDQIFRGDFNGSIFRAVANSATADWTLEITVAKTGGAQGTNGWFGIATDPASETLSSALYLKDDRISIEAGATDLDFMVGTGFSSGTYHTIRIAHDSVANSYYYWVNGTLLNSDLSTAIAPGNGNINASGATFIGDYSSSLSGNYSIDSIRIDSTGAYAPVPEPAPALLGSFGLLALLRRRRD
jgi:hypothetical protein